MFLSISGDVEVGGRVLQNLSAHCRAGLGLPLRTPSNHIPLAVSPAPVQWGLRGSCELLPDVSSLSGDGAGFLWAFPVLGFPPPLGTQEAGNKC